MDIVPAVGIGWWNAWIIMLAGTAAAFVPLLISASTVEARIGGPTEVGAVTGRTRVAALVTHVVLWPAAAVYSIVLPLERGSWWLLSGLVVSGVAVGLQLAASVAFATAPVDVPITSGVYAVSRHPMYVAGTLLFAGIGLAATSWVFLAAAVVWFAAWWYAVPEEELAMLDRYGDAYRRYREQTPRWLGVPRRRSVAVRPRAGARRG